KGYGYGIRRTLDLFFEQLMNALVLRIFPLGTIPLDQKLLSRCLCQQLQFTNSLVWIYDNALYQIEKMLRQTSDSRFIKQICVIGKITPKLTTGFFHEEL